MLQCISVRCVILAAIVMSRNESHSPNPYQYKHRRELGKIAWDLILALRQKRTRTLEERRDFAQRVDWLLCAYLWLTHEMDMVEHLFNPDAFLADAYMEHYEDQERRLRHSIFTQAQMYVMKDNREAHQWSIFTRTDGASIAQHVYNNPAGLRIALDALERIWRERRGDD